MIFYQVNPDNDDDILIAFKYKGRIAMKEGRYYKDEDGYFGYDDELIEDVIAWTPKPMINLFY